LELARLPAKLRAPVTLCYLEGKTFAEAAKKLGWPVGTVSGRLTKARQLLHARLSRRGITLSAAVLTTVLAQEVRAAPLPSALRAATMRAALSLVGGNSSVLPLTVNLLVQGVLHTMWINKLKAAAAIGLTLFVLATGAGVAYQKLVAAAEQPGEQPAVKPRPSVPVAQLQVVEQEQIVPHVPPLPALSGQRVKDLAAAAPVSDKMRKLLEGLLAAAQAEVEARWTHYNECPMTTSELESLLLAAKHLLRAEREISFRKSDQLEALQGHLDRMKRIEEVVQVKVTNGERPKVELDEARFYRIEAEILLERARAGRVPAPED
jgi:Sigma-70, region 4